MLEASVRGGHQNCDRQDGSLAILRLDSARCRPSLQSCSRQCGWRRCMTDQRETWAETAGEERRPSLLLPLPPPFPLPPPTATPPPSFNHHLQYIHTLCCPCGPHLGMFVEVDIVANSLIHPGYQCQQEDCRPAPRLGGERPHNPVQFTHSAVSRRLVFAMVTVLPLRSPFPYLSSAVLAGSRFAMSFAPLSSLLLAQLASASPAANNASHLFRFVRS